VTTLNLEGDQQSDLSVHGGVDKAVYAYPSEHYQYWRRELPQTDLPWGVFGENLTIEGLLEENVRIGDHLRVGSAEFVVTQPRMPCFKLGIRFGRPDIMKRFLRSGRTGFYFAVLLEGEVGAGDSIELMAQAEGGLTVADVVNLYTVDAENQELLRRATQQGHRIKIGGLGRMANSAFGGKLNLCGTSAHLFTMFVVALVVDNKYNVYVR